MSPQGTAESQTQRQLFGAWNYRKMCCRPSKKANDRFIRVGFIGLGGVFPLHLRAVQRLPNVKIVGCHDVDKKRVIAAQQLGLPVFDRLPELFATHPDIVHVLVPPGVHVEVATYALTRGVNCFLEKPVALSLLEFEELARACALSQKKVAVNHNQLFNPGFLAAVRMIRSRQIGALEHIHVHYGLSAPFGVDHFALARPRNIVWEIAPHPLSLICYLLGNVLRVHAQVIPDENEILSWRKWQGTLICERGSASCYVSSDASSEALEIAISGEDASIHVDLLRGMAYLSKKLVNMPLAEEIYGSIRLGTSLLFQSSVSACRTVSALVAKHRLDDPYSLSMAASVHNFYSSLVGTDYAVSDMSHAKSVVQACEMVIQSLERNGHKA